MNLSIIIPTFNSQTTIKGAINSCLSGNLTNNVEIILVDDGSTDSTVEIVRKFFKHEIDLGIIKIINTNHSGAGNARNIGIKASTGTWLSFLDSDDKLINNDFLLKLIQLKYDNVEIINIFERNALSKNYNVVSHDSAFYNDIYLSNLGLVNKKEECWNSGPVSKLYKREFLLKHHISFPKNVMVGEDMVFNNECLKQCNNILQVNNKIYSINKNNTNSITHTVIKKNFYKDNCNLINIILPKIPQNYRHIFLLKRYFMFFVQMCKAGKSLGFVNKHLLEFKKKYKLFFEKEDFYVVSTFLDFKQNIVLWSIVKFPSIGGLLCKLISRVKYKNGQ